MHRRKFLLAGAGAALAVSAAAQVRPAVLELRWIRMRNTSANQRQLTTEFLSKGLAPAAKRAGLGPLGFFSAAIAQDSPSILIVTSFPSLGGMEAAMQKLAADKEFQEAQDRYHRGAELSYMRMETTLLRSFGAMPAIEVPPSEGKRPPRIFELRIYESNNLGTLRRKIRMFEEGEIAVFRKCGLLPVFFGQAMAGSNLPNLTYMVAFDDLAAREKAWRTFANDPEWQKLRAQTGYADAEIVSNISNSILQPLPFSDIR